MKVFQQERVRRKNNLQMLGLYLFQQNIYFLILEMQVNVRVSDVKIEEQYAVRTEVKAEAVKTEARGPTESSYRRIRGVGKERSEVQIYFRMAKDDYYQRCSWKRMLYESSEGKTGRNAHRRRKNSSDDDYSVKNQKKDRNVTSNLIHHLMKYLITSESTFCLAEKLIAKKNIPITLGQFKVKLLAQNSILKTYVTIRHIRELWFSAKAQKKEFCQLMRMLSHYFLCNHGFLSIYFSNKFNRNSKITHYRGLRSLIQVLSKRDFNVLKLIPEA